MLELNEEGTHFAPSFSFGVEEPEPPGARVSAEGALARRLLASGTCFVLDSDPAMLARLDPAERDLLERLSLKVCVPLICLKRLTGILLLGSDRPRWRLHRGDCQLLEVLASQASLAFENAALYRTQRERLDRLHRAERLAAVGQLAAGVAHEIRNPLTAIRSTIQYLLQDLPKKTPKRELVEELLGEVDRINSTVGGLLSLSRSGEAHLAEIDVREPVESAIHLLQARAREQGVEIQASLGEECRLVGDAGQLKQVFVNLLLNALQSISGAGQIAVSAAPWRAQPGGAPMVQVTVADTGSGIAPDQLRFVFNPFFTTKTDGSGLGLAICHRIVEQHWGEIAIETHEGRGTTVAVRLPCRG